MSSAGASLRARGLGRRQLAGAETTRHTVARDATLMRPTLARTALRQRTSVLPLLLCASVPPVPQPERVVDKLIPKLSATAGLDLGSTVEQRIRLAWQDAWEEQAKDIDELEAADLSSRRRLDLQQLLTDSENVTLSDERAGTTGEQALRSDLTRARAVTRDLMRFWRFSTTQTDEFLSVGMDAASGGSALLIGADLAAGSSDASAWFGSPRLHGGASDGFDIVDVELYALKSPW